MFKPAFIVLDYETVLLDGTPSVEYYRDDFRVISCSFSWRNEAGEHKSLFKDSESAILKVLKKIEADGIPVIVHNAQFEMGVTSARFADIALNFHADTMRLVQVADNGGKAAQMAQMKQELTFLEELQGEEVKPIKTGLGLQVSASRWLPEKFHNHKEPFHAVIREQGIKKGQEGRNLHLLTIDQLEEYNTADTYVTMLLFETLTKKFENEGYDWLMDHMFYMTSARMIAESRARGLEIDLTKLDTTIETVSTSIEGTWSEFSSKFRNEIEMLEADQWGKYVNMRKTEKGRTQAMASMQADPSIYQFNLSSTKQKADLFINRLGIQPKYMTKKGAPAFGKAFLNQWGEGGKMLAKRGSAILLQTQAKKLRDLATRDGKWHVDLKAAGTATGRFAGAGGLNVQGLARREESLMGAIKARPRHSFVSVDLSAGEPTIITHFSKDPNYFNATFGMVGKAPFYDDNEVLQIDDIYLMGASVSPVGRDAIFDAFHSTFDGLSFADMWLKDPEFIKKELKSTRAFHKILILGLGYSMGPKKMCESAFQAGYVLSMKDAKAMFKAYWGTLFPKVKSLATRLESQYKQTGFLINPFGYRIVPDPSYKALNYFIQSSVNGIMAALNIKFFALAPYAKFVTVIHDELIIEVPDDKLEDAREAMRLATESLNQDLGWQVNVRTGWAVGKDLYTAK